MGCRAVCILIRVAACGVPACDDKELRASAAERLRPADACGIDSACGQPAAADFRRAILQQPRLHSSRQPAAAPGRRAASSRCSKAGPSARLRAGLASGPIALETEPPPARSWRPGPCWTSSQSPIFAELFCSKLGCGLPVAARPSFSAVTSTTTSGCGPPIAP